MKAYIFLTLFILFNFSLLNGQKDVKWGKITPEELQLKSIALDPKAPAVVLSDFGSVEVGPRTEYNRHVRIKILNENGLNYAVVEIPFKSYRKFDIIDDLKAQTLNTDENGKITAVKVKRSEMEEKATDDRNSKIIIRFRDVKPGSVIEYKYSIKSLDLVKLNNWYFQSTIPTLISDFTVSIPRRFNYLVTYQKGRNLSINEQKDYAERLQWLYSTRIKKAHRELLNFKNLLYSSDNGTAKVYLNNGETMHFKMKDIPALNPKSDMFAFSDYYPAVKMHLYYVDQSFGLPFYYRTILESARTDYGSWNPNRLLFDNYPGYIIYWLPTWEEFNSTWLKDDRLGKCIQKSFNTKLLTDTVSFEPDESNLKTLYNIVTSKIKWNGNYSMYSADDLNKVIKRGTANSGELNLTLIALLKRASFNVVPVLIRTRELGKPETMYPVSEQFNHVIALVKLDGKDIYLDATSTEMGKLPKNVSNALGWQLDNKNFNWLSVTN